MLMKTVTILIILLGLLMFARGCAMYPKNLSNFENKMHELVTGEKPHPVGGNSFLFHGGLIIIGIGILINIFRPRTIREYAEHVARNYRVYAKCNNCGWQGSGKKFKKNNGECPYCGSDDFGILRDRLPEKVKAHIKKKGW